VTGFTTSAENIVLQFDWQGDMVYILDKIHWEELSMSQHVYKLIELTGSSPNSMEEAIENAIERAAQSVRHMRWFEVISTRGHIEEGKVAHWQVTVKVGFTLED